MYYDIPHGNDLTFIIAEWIATHNFCVVECVLTGWKEDDNDIEDETIDNECDQRKIMNKKTFLFC